MGALFQSKGKTMARLTINEVNKALNDNGHAERLYKGNGYFYFWDGEAPNWYTSSVPVFRLGHIPTVDGWLKAHAALKADDAKRRGKA